jgi:hypothetical protein
VGKSGFISGGVIGTPLAERKPGLSRRYGAAATAEKPTKELVTEGVVS